MRVGGDAIIVNRLLYPWPYLAMDLYMQLMDLLFEAEIKMIFPLHVPLMVLRFGFSISPVDFVYTHVSHKYMELKSTSNYVIMNFLHQNDV